MPTLVLGRREGESVEIGPNITVTIREMHGRQCKIAITAPPEVHIRRSELPPLPAKEAQP